MIPHRAIFFVFGLGWRRLGQKRFEKLIGSGRSDLRSIRPAFGLERPDLGTERPN